jgi:hypothetical protein
MKEKDRPRKRPAPGESTVQPRRPGGWEGRVWIADDFDAPLPDDQPDDLLDAFEGRDTEAPENR